MVPHQDQLEVLKAVSNPERLSINALLAQKMYSAGELAS